MKVIKEKKVRTMCTNQKKKKKYLNQNLRTIWLAYLGNVYFKYFDNIYQNI